MHRPWSSRLNGPGLITFIAAIAIWEAAIRSGLLQFDYLPAPSAIAFGLGELVKEGVLLPDLLHTLLSVLLGWSIALVIGVGFGLLLGFSRSLRRYSLASIEILRPMPGVALAPVGLLLFGFSLETELVVTVLPVLWPILINTMGGVMAVNSRLGEVGATLRLDRRDILTRILLPAALPSILVGARIGLGLALVLAVVAEIVGNPEGLGYGILREQQALRPDLMFAYIVVVGLLGILLNAAIVGLSDALFPFAAGRAGQRA